MPFLVTLKRSLMVSFMVCGRWLFLADLHNDPSASWAYGHDYLEFYGNHTEERFQTLAYPSLHAGALFATAQLHLYFYRVTLGEKCIELFDLGEPVMFRSASRYLDLLDGGSFRGLFQAFFFLILEIPELIEAHKLHDRWFCVWYDFDEVDTTLRIGFGECFPEGKYTKAFSVFTKKAHFWRGDLAVNAKFLNGRSDYRFCRILGIPTLSVKVARCFWFEPVS